VDEQPIMQWQDGVQTYFNAIGLTSAEGNAALWRVHENSGKQTVQSK